MSNEKPNGLLNIDSSLYKTRISKKFSTRKPYAPADPGEIVSFIPGTVLEILVSPGKKVRKGDDLMIIDAMKMKNRLKAGIAGVVKSVAVNVGDKVSKGDVLIRLES
jgi:biotin carboxyl carrier protein